MVLRVATDIGGTFTDLVCQDGDTLSFVKANTVVGRFEQGIADALRESGIDAASIDYFAHGSTIIINTLTERKGAITGLVTTTGFRDVLEIARGNTPDLFNINYRKPAPFVRRRLRREVDERTDYRGNVLVPVDLDQLARVVDDFRRDGVEAIAICFLHAYANPENEQRAAQWLRGHWPEVQVLASSEVCREWREYERTSTAVLSAYVKPAATTYLNRLRGALGGTRRADPFVMQSNGGVTTVSGAIRDPIALVESGPASGMLGAAALGRMLGERNLLALDIGGTTAKCALLAGGEPRIVTDYYIERTPRSPGYPIRTPVVDLVEIGNGGGSVAWLDDALCLHVGPESAGSTPGPVAYGKGGRRPTITDANLLLGRIDLRRLGGCSGPVDLGVVEEAFATLAAPLQLGAHELARGVLRIANANMVNALKLVSMNRGHDPRVFKLLCFGGGGPIHAAALARELHIPEVIVPPHASVFSAWGMLMVDLRRDFRRTRVCEAGEGFGAVFEATFRELEDQAREDFGREGYAAASLSCDRRVDARYKGQEHTVSIAVPSPDAVSADLAGTVVAAFEASHEAAFGFRLPGIVEIVNFHVVCRAPVDKPVLPRPALVAPATPPIPDRHRRVDFLEQASHETPVYDRSRLGVGACVAGPAVIEEATTVTIVGPGDRVRVDELGCLRIEVAALA